MTGTEIHRIRAGSELGKISYTTFMGARREIFELHEGLLPDRSADKASIHAFVAQSTNGFDEAVVVVEETGEGEVAVAIEPRAPELLEHPEHVQGLVNVALRECGIDTRTDYIDEVIVLQGALGNTGVALAQL